MQAKLTQSRSQPTREQALAMGWRWGWHYVPGAIAFLVGTSPITIALIGTAIDFCQRISQ